MSLLGSYTKQPAEIESYTINYADDLTTGDNVASALVSVSPATMTIDSYNVDDPRVRVWVSGGVSGVTYKITVKATTADGRVLEDEFKVKVKEY